jgi:hypothetical protein
MDDTTTVIRPCSHPDCRHQNHHEVDRVWAMRRGDGVDRSAYEAASAALGAIDRAWSRTATACSDGHPCYGCCLRALRALEAAENASGPAQEASDG